MGKMKSLGVLTFLSFLAHALTSHDLLSTATCGFTDDCEAYPWLVYIPLENDIKNAGANSRCVGTLISKRHVLTYTSCMQQNTDHVHIGQYFVSINLTCSGGYVRKIGIEQKIATSKWDVVLLKLQDDVEFGDDVQPICLPFEIFRRVDIGTEVYSAGWGISSHTDAPSDIMKNVTHTIVENKECEGILNDNQFMCVKHKQSYDTSCHGDEGGPIMFRNKGQWILEGILTHISDSFNIPCATQRPARGIRITKDILKWIVDKVDE